MTMKGIDISNYQAGLDLAKARSAGIEFAICKISEGRTYRDRQFDTFYAQAAACGLPIGAYVYSHATTPEAAAAEANLAMTILDGRPLQLGIYMDIETETQMEITKSQLTVTIHAFCRTVEAAGYRSGIYGGEYNVFTRIDPADFPDSLIWIAHYGKEPAIPCDLWQKTDKGSFPDYSGPVDADDVMSERMAAIIKGVQPDPDPEPAPVPKPAFSPAVLELQLAMALDGYWPIERCDGLKTPEFIEAFRIYSADVLSC